MRFTVTILSLMMTLFFALRAQAEEHRETAFNEDYVDRLVEGHRLYANNQHDAALRAYQSALEAQADDALATYLVGCVQRSLGNNDDALLSFRRAIELAGDNDGLEARAMMNIAFVQEARRDFEAAREAWRAYIAFGESHQGVTTYLANARARLDAINAVTELDAAYQTVRERIAADQPAP